MEDFKNDVTTDKWGKLGRQLASFLVGVSVHTHTHASLSSDMHNIHVLNQLVSVSQILELFCLLPRPPSTMSLPLYH